MRSVVDRNVAMRRIPVVKIFFVSEILSLSIYEIKAYKIEVVSISIEEKFYLKNCYSLFAESLISSDKLTDKWVS